MSKQKLKYLPASVSSAVIVTNEINEVLLLKQASEEKGKKWGPPAGKMDAFEDPIKTAKRETQEEIGIDPEIINLIGIYVVPRHENMTSIAFAFRGAVEEQKIKINEDEIEEFKFFSREDVNELYKNEKLYIPEFNKVVIDDFFKEVTFPLDMINSLPTVTKK